MCIGNMTLKSLQPRPIAHSQAPSFPVKHQSGTVTANGSRNSAPSRLLSLNSPQSPPLTLTTPRRWNYLSTPLLHRRPLLSPPPPPLTRSPQATRCSPTVRFAWKDKQPRVGFRCEEEQKWEEARGSARCPLGNGSRLLLHSSNQTHSQVLAMNSPSAPFREKKITENYKRWRRRRREVKCKTNGNWD